MKRDLFVHLTDEHDDYSLAQLARAIAVAPRPPGLPVWRAFIRTRSYQPIDEAARTQRLQHVRP